MILTCWWTAPGWSEGFTVRCLLLTPSRRLRRAALRNDTDGSIRGRELPEQEIVNLSRSAYRVLVTRSRPVN